MKKTALSAAALLLTLATAAVSAHAEYNDVILADKPVMFLGMDTPGSAQSDLSGNGNSGSYVGGTPGSAALPNGDKAADFNGSSQYLTVPASPALSVPTSKALTIESWIRPDVLNFSHTENEGFVYWLGKGNPGQGYEYANRMYSYANTAGRPNRISDYQWNASGGLGSGAYFQEPVTAGQWIYVVDTIDMSKGTIAIYKNGVLKGTVPLSQYNVTPATTQSPFNVGTRNNNSYFQGAVGKVAVYNRILTSAQIAAHYSAMMNGGGSTPPPVASAPAITNVAASAVAQNSATIGWTTDKVSASQVEYGLSTSYGSLTPQSSATSSSHSVALTGLTAGTVYHYRVKSLDSATGLTGVSGDNTFTTSAATVASAPAITAIQAAGVTQNAATINWTTDQASHSQVEYGLTASYGTLSYQSTATGTSHQIPLSGLQAGTVYHYRVKSLNDTTGLTGVSGDNTFTTSAAPVASAPSIGGVAAAPSNTGASISWTTDKVSHSQVEYGLTTSYGTLSYQSVATGTSHNLVLSGLVSGTVYHYRVKSLDSTTGLTGVSGDLTFTTTGGSVPPPPVASNVISNVTASVTSSGASISWNTTLVSHSQVEYGLTSAYGTLSYESTHTGTAHNLVLNGLRSGTTYHYRVKSLDASGNTAVSGDMTFTTSRTGA